MHAIFHDEPLGAAFLLGAGALAASAALPDVLFAHTGGSSRLVVVILRGALDGLAAVPPYADPDLCRACIASSRSPRRASPMVHWHSTAPSACIPPWRFCTSATSPANWWFSMPSPRPIAIDRISTVKTCSENGLTKPSARPTAGSIGRSPPYRAAPGNRASAP